MRQRLEVLGAVLAAVGAVVTVQQAFSTPGALLPAGVYLTIAGVVLLVIGGLRPGASRVTWPARIVTIVSLLVVIPLALLSIALCGPTVLVFDCRA